MFLPGDSLPCRHLELLSCFRYSMSVHTHLCLECPLPSAFRPKLCLQDPDPLWSFFPVLFVNRIAPPLCPIQVNVQIKCIPQASVYARAK